MRWSVVLLRMFDAQRNAARCVHMSAAKYSRMDSTEKPSAHQPYVAMPLAAPQFGATAMRSRATSQMHTYGAKLTSMEIAESAQPTYVSGLRPPATSSSCAMGPRCFCLGAFRCGAPDAGGAEAACAVEAAETCADMGFLLLVCICSFVTLS